MCDDVVFSLIFFWNFFNDLELYTYILNVRSTEWLCFEPIKNDCISHYNSDPISNNRFYGLRYAEHNFVCVLMLMVVLLLLRTWLEFICHKSDFIAFKTKWKCFASIVCCDLYIDVNRFECMDFLLTHSNLPAPLERIQMEILCQLINRQWRIIRTKSIDRILYQHIFTKHINEPQFYGQK